MKIVLDTTEFISGAFWAGHSRTLIQRCFDGLEIVYATDDILDEVRRVIQMSKFRHTIEAKKQAIIKIEKLVKKILVKPEHKAPADACRDHKDIKFLECAAAAKADYIISGDLDLLDLKEYNGIKIINAKDYLTIVNS